MIYRKIKKTRVFVIMIFLSFFSIFNLFGLGNKETQPNVERTANSPSGRYSYFLEEVDNSYAVSIYENNNFIFSDNQLYRKQDRFFITWHEESDVLWLYSGDIGTFYFCFENDKWCRGTFSDGKMKGVDIPLAFKNAVPRLRNY